MPPFDSSKPFNFEKLRFYAFQHPYVCTFVERLQKDGVAELLTPANQLWQRDNAAYKDTAGASLKPPKGPYFKYRYKPGDVVSPKYPRYDVDFDLSGAYAQYNWELFFHIPLLIATRLMQDQRHDEARHWFHYIFNPTAASEKPAPQRYWFFKPLRDLGKPEAIKQTLQKLQPVDATHDELEAQIEEWRKHPFEPHRIARGRPGAYQKSVVMKYLDNLIAWGDKLFARDTIESINEATQLYVLAANLLGPRPERVPELATPVAKTYADLRPELDAFSNVLVSIESTSTPHPFIPGPSKDSGGAAGPPLDLATLYFCIPHNDSLLQYWDTVADRLFKIRHCMNIEGSVRELPLFEPPIDPALLVRARAMGLDLASVLDDLSAPAPHYRFPFMLQKAREFCEELKQLGGLVMAALEKKDAEELAQLRAGQEKALLQAVRDVKKQQIKEADNTLAGLEQARAQASLRQQFYSSRAFTIAGEREQLEMLTLSTVLETAGQGFQLAASFAHAWPDQFIGSLAGAGGGALWLSRVAGGSPSGSALQSAGRAMEILGGVAQAHGSASGILAGYRRRADDWKLQADIAKADVKQLDKQILAADIRRQIAERDLANHELQIEQAAKVDEFLREKFTNQDLYAWMSSQLSAAYSQAYRLAYDMAKRAERAYRMELGVAESRFIQFGAWETLRKGLLAGERLSLDLRRLDSAYIDQNKRTYELIKHVSLAQLDPNAIIRLRETGECEVLVPEVLFDLDYPGHYQRRIKSVSMTIPSVTGPYTTLSCTLTLLKHWLRRDTTKPKESPEATFGLTQSIATSGGRNDTGLFELSFRDERRLPFEGVGAVSLWRVELPANVRQFDYDTISDVILHVNYTALEGGEGFKQLREKQLTAGLNELAEVLSGEAGATGLYRAFSFRHEFPDEWHRLRQGQTVTLEIGPDRLPYFVSVLKPKIEGATWLAKSKQKPSLSGNDTPIIAWVQQPDIPELWRHDGTLGLNWSPPQAVALAATGTEPLEALWLVIRYTVS